MYDDALEIFRIASVRKRYGFRKCRQRQRKLIDAATDEHLWSETYSREFSDIFAIESDIATNIARALRVQPERFRCSREL